MDNCVRWALRQPDDERSHPYSLAEGACSEYSAMPWKLPTRVARHSASNVEFFRPSLSGAWVYASDKGAQHFFGVPGGE